MSVCTSFWIHDIAACTSGSVVITFTTLQRYINMWSACLPQQMISLFCCGLIPPLAILLLLLLLGRISDYFAHAMFGLLAAFLSPVPFASCTWVLNLCLLSVSSGQPWTQQTLNMQHLLLTLSPDHCYPRADPPYLPVVVIIHPSAQPPPGAPVHNKPPTLPRCHHP